MTPTPPPPEGVLGPWDEERVKALLSFPRYPVRLVQEEPWQTWISQRGGLRGVYDFLRDYSFSPSHRRILDVVLSRPDEIADVYADHLNISRATYFYRLRELVPAVVHALNQWHLSEDTATPALTAVFASLPTPLTALIGVEDTLATLVTLLARPDVRMLTLLGPGGVGKTRLGIELARRASVSFPIRAFFVDLSDLPSSSPILVAIGEALGLEAIDEREITSGIARQPSLLLLDNFEHLITQAPAVGDLLVAVPDLKVVVTSRAALHVYGEYQFIVPALPVPGPSDLLDLRDRFPAVALFVQRARAVNPAFELTAANSGAVAELCQRLDGIPLAIELAAFQAKYYSPQAMLVRLSTSNRLSFLSTVPRGLYSHQQTPREMLDWSYRLLDHDQQIMFSQMSVFAGGCTIDAASEVCAPLADNLPIAAGLAALAEQSLLQQHIQPDGEPRYAMLGTAREYASEQLDLRGETLTYERRFAEYYLRLAETPSVSPSSRLETLRLEDANLVASLAWFLASGEGESALRLVLALWGLWQASGEQPEAYRLLRDALERTPDTILPVRARVLWLAGWLAHQRSDLPAMSWCFGAMSGLAAVLADAQSRGLAELGLAEIARWQGRWPDAARHASQALELLQDPGNRGHAQWVIGRIALSQGDPLEALAHFQESAALFEVAGDPRARADALCGQGQALYFAGRSNESALVFEEAVHLKQTHQDSYSPSLAIAGVYLALIEARQGRLDTASEGLEASFALSKQQGYLSAVDLAHDALARLAVQAAGLSGAKRAFRESLLIQETIRESWRVLDLLEAVAGVLIGIREPLAAARLMGAAAALRAALRVERFAMWEAPYQEVLAQLHAQLDTVTLDDAWGAGQTLSLEQAMIYALRCLE